MKLSRREFLLSGLAAIALAGCQQAQNSSSRPGPFWPENGSGDDLAGPIGRSSTSPSSSSASSAGGAGGGGGRVGGSGAAAGAGSGVGGVGAAGGAGGGAPVAITGTSLKAIPRSSWADASPIMSRIQPMESIDKITVHHEGWTPVYFSDYETTGKRMDAIRAAHLQRLGAGDIGYHFVIDRAGRLWQGRDIRYQGAHVKEHNPHNVGVMCLGNFDLQRPTDAQMVTLRATLSSLMKQYRVSVKMVYTHQELNPTECPGKVLQQSMISLRRSGLA